MKKLISTVRGRGWMAIAALAGGLLFASCNKSHNDDNNSNTPVAALMAFNLSPDLSQAGFALSGSNLTQVPLTFNSYTGGYLAIYPGTRSVESYNYSSGTSLVNTNYTFEDSTYYSVFLVGTAGAYQNVIVKDNLDSLPATDQAYVRYINAIPDASSPTVTIASGGTNVVNDNAAFPAVSGFTAVNAGTVTVNVTNGGTITANRDITLESKKVYTILLSGTPGGTGDNAVQIKFITNGTVEGNTGKMSSSSARVLN
ncbi:MAG: DUF4397 domain-containing protein [Chitinophagaceae bacterium]